MTETTTIEVRTNQAEQLREIQRQNGNYKTAIDRLLETWWGESETINADDLAARIVDHIGADVGGPQVDDSEIAREVAQQIDYAHLADKVSEQVVREIGGR
jgi:predicted DsbA family dithiol-disulfide isomerase